MNINSIENKFFPPRTDSIYISKIQKLQGFIGHRREESRIVLIEAQAGQGKSTFAAQLLRDSALGIWYSISTEDQDLTFFISSFIFALEISLPDFHSSQLKEEVVPVDWTGWRRK